MSTNKTANYGLHLWEPGDDFLRAEFNANFSALDAAARVVCGVYAGDGAASRSIALSFTPRAVLVMREDAKSADAYTYYGGLALAGRPSIRDGYPVVTVEAGGFRVYVTSITSNYNVASNTSGCTYHYAALR